MNLFFFFFVVQFSRTESKKKEKKEKQFIQRYKYNKSVKGKVKIFFSVFFNQLIEPWSEIKRI